MASRQKAASRQAADSSPAQRKETLPPLAKNLQRIRESNGLTIADLEKITGVSRISQILTGVDRKTRRSTVVRIAQGLTDFLEAEVSADELLSGALLREPESMTTGRSGEFRRKGMPTPLAINVDKMRIAYGFTLAELQKVSGVSRVRHIAAGIDRHTRRSTVERLAKAMSKLTGIEITADELLELPDRIEQSAEPTVAISKKTGRQVEISAVQLVESGPHTLGHKIMRKRSAQGVTQKELAKRCGSSQGIISLLERGGIESPGILLIQKAEDALGLLPGELSVAARGPDESLERFLASEYASDLRVTAQEAERLRAASWKRTGEWAPLSAWGALLQAIRETEAEKKLA